MTKKVLALALAAGMLLPACAENKDPAIEDISVDSLAPPAPPGGSGTPTSATTKPSIPVRPPPPTGPPPDELLTADDLSGVTGLPQEWKFGNAFAPPVIDGVCGDTLKYKEARSVQATVPPPATATTTAGGKKPARRQVVYQSVFTIASAADATTFMDDLAKNKPGCTWKTGKTETKYVGKTEGVKSVADGIFAYHSQFPEAGGAGGNAVYVRKGDMILRFGFPAEITVDTINQIVAKSLA